MTAITYNEPKSKAFEGFAPLADAFEAMLNLEVPDAARNLVKRTTDAGEKVVTDGRDAAEKATATIESTAVSSIRELGKISRAVHTAVYQDAEALLAGLGKLSAAASPSDAFAIQFDFVRGRADAAAQRVKAVVSYVGRVASEGVGYAK
jgi:hypothetical protein